MLNLIEKDFRFTVKWVMAAIAYGVIVSFVMAKEVGDNSFFTFFLVPFFVVSLPLGKILNMEDNANTRDFIKRMPYSTLKIVAARVLFVIILLLIAFLCVLVSNFSKGNISGYKEYISQLIIYFEGFLAYFLVYLSFYYRKSYYAAQNCIIICAVAAFSVAFLAKHFSVNISLQNIYVYQVGIILGIIDLLLFGVTYICARKNNFN